MGLLRNATRSVASQAGLIEGELVHIKSRTGLPVRNSIGRKQIVHIDLTILSVEAPQAPSIVSNFVLYRLSVTGSFSNLRTQSSASMNAFAMKCVVSYIHVHEN